MSEFGLGLDEKKLWINEYMKLKKKREKAKQKREKCAEMRDLRLGLYEKTFKDENISN